MAENLQESKNFLDSGGPDTNRTNQRNSLKDHEENSTKLAILQLLKKKGNSLCTKKTLYKRLPVLNWLNGYTKSFFISDMLAGLTVGLTAIPQGIAYAVIAGLQPQYGLYSGFMGCFVYFLMGSVKDITIGPTAIMALMAKKCVESFNSDFAVLLCFLSGCIILVFGILHLGFLVNFISVPVTLGFTTAAAITIASSQLKGLLGIEGKSNEFLESWISVVEHIGETKYQDLLLGLITIFFLVATKYINDKISRNCRNRTNVSGYLKFYKESWKLLSLGRNAVAVVIGTIAAYIFEVNGMTPFRLIGKVKGGLPEFKPPPFSSTIFDAENNTTQIINFQEMVVNLGTGIISVPMISMLETIAIAKAFSKGKTLDATQEMIALGAANIMGSFVSSMPTAGSFTRTAVNNASGVKTPLGGLFTGTLVLSALSLTATFKYIPKTTLSAVIMTAMFYMVEYHEISLIWKTKKTDIVPLIVTVMGCLLLGLDYGILIGIFVNLTFILYNAARPKVTLEEFQISDLEILLIQPSQTLIYPSAEYIKELVLKASRSKPRNLIVVEGRNIHSIDATVAKNLKTLTEDLKRLDLDLIFWNWHVEPMKTCWKLDENLKKYFKNLDSLEELVKIEINEKENI